MQVTLGEASIGAISAALKTSGLCFTTGPFIFRISSSLPVIADGLKSVYAAHPFCVDAPFSDFHIRLDPTSGLRRVFKPKVYFHLDNHIPFQPMPASQAFALLEWGMNWCISTYAHQYLKVHAAVLENEAGVIVMPGAPGAGKSTLCAALSFRGWRLYSDELALVDPVSLRVEPAPRPISLKNQSIDIIREFDDRAIMGPVSKDTHKGTIAHVAPYQPASSAGVIKRIVFPRYSPGAKTSFVDADKGNAFIRLAEQSFNYSLLGEGGFNLVGSLLDAVSCHDLVYSNLDEAVQLLSGLDC